MEDSSPVLLVAPIGCSFSSADTVERLTFVQSTPCFVLSEVLRDDFTASADLNSDSITIQCPIINLSSPTFSTVFEALNGVNITQLCSGGIGTISSANLF